MILSISTHKSTMSVISETFPSGNTILHLELDFPWTSDSIFATTASSSFSDIKSIDLLIRESSAPVTSSLNAILLQPIVCSFSTSICFKVGLSVIYQSPELLGNLPDIGSGE